MTESIQGDPKVMSQLAKGFADLGENIVKQGNQMLNALNEAQRAHKWSDSNQQAVQQKYMEAFNLINEAHRRLGQVAMETMNHANRYQKAKSGGG